MDAIAAEDDASMACSGGKSRISDAAYIREARRHRGHSWHSTHRWKAGRPRRRSDRPQRGRHTHWRPRRVAERRPRDRAGRAHEREGRRDAGALHAEQAHWRAARGQSSERAHRHARHRHPHAAVLFIKLLHVLLVVLLHIFPMLPAANVLLTTRRTVVSEVHITIVAEVARHSVAGRAGSGRASAFRNLFGLDAGADNGPRERRPRAARVVEAARA